MRPDTAVLIGRFQPPHRAHLELMLGALEQSSEVVIVLGSARSARTVRNPLSDQGRASLIAAMLAAQGADLRRVRLRAVADAFYNLPLWVRTVKQAVGAQRAALHGFEKDVSSFYLKLFPDWTLTPPRFQSALNATDIREAMYGGDWQQVTHAVAPKVLPALQAFARTPEFAELLADREAIRVLAGRGPIRSAGVLLVSGGQMLLSRRTERPGLGLLSIPEADTAWGAAQSVTQELDRGTFKSEQLRVRTLNNRQRLPGLDWQTRAGLYTLPSRTPPAPGAEWTDLEAVYAQPETFFADHAQGIRALLEDWPTG